MTGPVDSGLMVRMIRLAVGVLLIGVFLLAFDHREQGK
jgi:hypothetical protein